MTYSPPPATGAIIAATTAAATSAALAHERGEARNRRLSVRGVDQVLWLVKSDEDRVLETIANTFEGGYVKDGQVCIRHNSIFSGGWAVGGFILVASILFILEFVVFKAFSSTICGTSYSWGCSLPFDINIASIISVVVAIVFGFYGGRLDEEIDYINVSNIGNETSVLIDKYTSEGYRNIDEDALMRILVELNKIDRK